MHRTILGKVSLAPKGEYSPNTAYTALDVVSYGGSSWLALKDVTGVEPAEGDDWMLLAQKGDQGEQGIQGIQGIQGETGGPGPTGPQGASFTRLEKTAGTGAPGTIDTYTAYNSEGQEAGTVQVYQGMDGTGAGDFKADGTVPMTGDLQMAQHKVNGLADATEDGDAVNKGQMDAGLAERADLTLSNLSNRQKALRNIGGRPNRNLLRNWYFAGGGTPGRFPINSKGKMSYTGLVPIIDSWGFSAGDLTLTITDNGIQVSLPSGISGRQYISQKTLYSLEGKTLTFSMLTQNNELITGTAVFPAASYSDIASIPDVCDIRLFNFSDGTDGIYIILDVGATVSIVAAKLELGSTQTLAYQDEDGAWQLFETPDYATEYVRCASYDDDGGYLGPVRGLGLRVNRNLLDNWYFVGGGSQQGGGQFPINQRGETSYPSGANGYYIDRWTKDAAVDITLSADGLIITTETAGSRATSQEMENVSQFIGKVLTLSVLAQGTGAVNLGYNDGSKSVYQGETPVSSSLTLISYTFTVPAELSGFRAIIRSVINDTSHSILLIAAKLELGPTQTLAYQDEDGNWQLFETPDYVEELAKCQRYLQVVGAGDGGNYFSIGYGMAFSTTFVRIPLYLPEVLREVVPTISFTGNLQLCHGSDLFDVTEIALDTTNSLNMVSIRANSNGLTLGELYQLRAKNDLTVKIVISAEL